MNSEPDIDVDELAEALDARENVRGEPPGGRLDEEDEEAASFQPLELEEPAELVVRSSVKEHGAAKDIMPNDISAAKQKRNSKKKQQHQDPDDISDRQRIGAFQQDTPPPYLSSQQPPPPTRDDRNVVLPFATAVDENRLNNRFLIKLSLVLACFLVLGTAAAVLVVTQVNTGKDTSSVETSPPTSQGSSASSDVPVTIPDMDTTDDENISMSLEEVCSNTDLADCVAICAAGSCCFTTDLSKTCDVVAPSTVCSQYEPCGVLFGNSGNGFIIASNSPSHTPSRGRSSNPTISPSASPTVKPSTDPTAGPSTNPSESPSRTAITLLVEAFKRTYPLSTTEIDRDASGFAGHTIPTQLGLLTLLTSLKLRGDSGSGHLIGSVPSELGQLTALTKLDLYYNELTSTLPTQLFQLTSLKYMSFGRPSNRMSGSGNKVKGSVSPGFGTLTALTHLNLYDNLMTGPLASQIGLLTALKYINLHGNSVTGTIPSQLGNLAALTSLRLSSNELSGPIPSQVGNMVDLLSFYCGGNELSGSIPSEVGQMISLQEFSPGSGVAGRLPSQMGQLKELKELGLYSTELTGPIPSEFGQMTSLQLLDINQLDIRYSRRGMSGSLPTELGLMESLTKLYVDFIPLMGGSVPSELGQLTALTDLSLWDINLVGPLPSEIGWLTGLTKFWACSNRLTSIPSEMGTLTALTSLDLCENSLQGSIPSQIGTMKALQYLDLWENSLNSTLPTQLGMLSNLYSFSCRSNAISGFIPTEIGMMAKLYELSLRDNDLSGRIPTELGLIDLRYLRLQGNRLTGTVPVLTESLRLLTLEDNSLEGTLPEDLCDMGQVDPSESSSAGLSFDCSDQLCGCCWCPCLGIPSNLSHCG